MNRTIAAVLIALSFTAGSIASTNADSLRLKPAQRTIQLQPKTSPAQRTIQPQPTQSPAQPTGGLDLQAKPFPANCVAGFQKYDEHKVTKAGVPVVQRFNCRTAWIECPNFPAYPQTWLEYEIEDQATGNEGKRIRFKYVCQGVDIAG